MTFSFYVPGKLKNFDNKLGSHWGEQSRYRGGWRDRVSAAWKMVRPHHSRMAIPSTPKRVTFHCYTFNRYDTDGLQAAVKPIRDQLVKEDILHSDAPTSGHEFHYEQEIRRGNLGVQITITTTEI